MTLIQDQNELLVWLNTASKYAKNMAYANNESNYINEQVINYEWGIFINEEVPEKFKVYVTNVHNNVYAQAIMEHLNHSEQQPGKLV